MEVVIPSPSQSLSIQSQIPAVYNAQADVDSKVLQSTIESKEKRDSVSIDLSDAHKSISITAKEIVTKLNEMLAEKLPDGIESLKPQQVTPEATADRIVRGATAFFSVYAEQNSDLEGEELLNSFMDTIRGGIDKGYEEAFSILEGLGAFEFEGVKEGIEETRRLIDSKLIAYEAEMRKQLELEPINVGERVADTVTDDIAQMAGGKLAIAA